MGKTVRIAAIPYLAPVWALGVLLSAPALAQDAGGGLVISALPSDTVISVLEPAALKPVAPVSAISAADILGRYSGNAQTALRAIPGVFLSGILLPEK